MTPNLLAYALAWFPLVVLALLVGALRDATFGRELDERQARRLTQVVAGVAFGVYTGVVVVLMPPGSSGGAWLVGGLWLTITVLLELPFRIFAPRPQPTLEDDLFAGPQATSARVGWPLLVWIGVAPWLFNLLIWRN